MERPGSLLKTHSCRSRRTVVSQVRRDSRHSGKLNLRVQKAICDSQQGISPPDHFRRRWANRVILSVGGQLLNES